MGWFRNNGEGYTRGGMDVESAINLFFKGVLLFPVFLFAGYIGIAMMKHMIFHGVPVMNTVTPVYSEVRGAPGVITEYEWELVELEYERDMQVWVRQKNEWFRNPTYTPAGESLYPQRPVRDTSKYEL